MEQTKRQKRTRRKSQSVKRAVKITCNHSASSYGQPVILDGHGQPMDYATGLTATLKRLNWSRAHFAEACGYKSSRSVEKFWQGVKPPASTLNQLGVALSNLS